MGAFDPGRLTAIIARHAGREGALLPLLQDVQHSFGYVPDDAVPTIAAALNLSRAEVHGVVTFYADFHREPLPPVVVKICRAEACRARGGDRAAARIEAALANVNDQVRIETVYCLGLCASGPAALVNDAPVARLSGDELERFISELI